MKKHLSPRRYKAPNAIQTRKMTAKEQEHYLRGVMDGYSMRINNLLADVLIPSVRKTTKVRAGIT